MKKRKFFERLEANALTVTYDDVRLKTGYAEVMPENIDLTTMFSRYTPLRMPIVSAAMDTITESRLAIAMAIAGGLGIIHRKLDPKPQAAEVARVKSHLNAAIPKPVTVYGDETIEEIENRRLDEGLSFQSFPVIDREGRLIGLLTKNDFDMCSDRALLAQDVMTKELVTAVGGTTLDEAHLLMQSHKKKVLPLITDGRIVGMYVLSDIKRIKTGNSNGYNIDPRGHLRVGAAIGTGEHSIKRAALLIEASVDVLVIDTAHGDSKPVFEMLREIKRLWPKTEVVVGNVSEGESARRLVDAGADGIKVGQGPGSICTTRIVAGIGAAQVSAVYNCAESIEGSGVPVCADGGIRNPGDITVAIGAGAYCVMLGNLLAGTEETPGQILTIKGVQWKIYRGMGSLGAMLESAESRQRYNQGKGKLVPEGVKSKVPFKGSIETHLSHYIGGLRSGMGYVGAATIEELREKADFNRFSPAGLAESHPHDVSVIEDSTNERNNNGIA